MPTEAHDEPTHLVDSHDGVSHFTEVALDETRDDEQRRERGVHLTLPASSLTAWQITDALAALVLVGLFLGFAQLPFAPVLLKTNLVAICLLSAAPSTLEILMLNPVRHANYSLSICPERLIVSQGWMFRQVVTVPRSSVLNLRFRRGPVLRRLGLTSVSILTIADRQKIGPLDATQVELIESFVNGDLRDVLA